MRSTFKGYMSEKRLVTRSFVLTIALLGGFVGAILMFFVMLLGILG